MMENPSCSIGVINPCCNASSAPIWTDTFEDLCALFKSHKSYSRKPKRKDYDDEQVQSKKSKRKAIIEARVQKFAEMKARGIL